MTIGKVWKYFVRIVLGSIGICILCFVGLILHKKYFGYHCIQGNCRKGFGVKEFNETRLTGEFRDYRLNGKGKGEYVTGCYYEGDFVDGYYDGYGVYDCLNSAGKYAKAKYKFEGYWIQGMANNQGTMTTISGKTFSGLWKEGLLCIKGNCQNGYGEVMFSYQNRILSGRWTNGKLNGYGTQTDSDGNIQYKGEFKDTHFHGKGTSYENGKVIQSGDWVRGSYRDPKDKEDWDKFNKMNEDIERKMKEAGRMDYMNVPIKK